MLSLCIGLLASSLEPGVVTFNAAATASGAGGRWEQALFLLDGMQLRGSIRIIIRIRISVVLTLSSH